LREDLSLLVFGKVAILFKNKPGGLVSSRFNNRSDLVADREAQFHYKKRVQQEAFGIYRPLTPASFQALHTIMSGAKEEIDEFLTRRRRVSAPVIVHSDMGITFVKRLEAKKAMRRGLLQRGFDLKLLQKGVDDYNEGSNEPLEVPIHELDWYTSHKRKLVGRFAISTAVEELSDDSETIGELLEQARGSVLRVDQPDHVAFFKYGRNGDNLDLSLRHQDDVTGIVERHLSEAGMASVMLDRLVVGSSYSVPLEAAA
jgi:hypothetical protein